MRINRNLPVLLIQRAARYSRQQGARPLTHTYTATWMADLGAWIIDGALQQCRYNAADLFKLSRFTSGCVNARRRPRHPNGSRRRIGRRRRRRIHARVSAGPR